MKWLAKAWEDTLSVRLAWSDLCITLAFSHAKSGKGRSCRGKIDLVVLRIPGRIW